MGFTFGLYPGISTNDGGSPNLQQTAGAGSYRTRYRWPRYPPGFPDFRQQGHGHRMAGRNIGLFGADAILNDMTLLGVGAGNGSYAAPADTSLGSIGSAYTYKIGSRRSTIRRPP